MIGKPVPSPEQVLRALFWKLLFRGRTSHQAQSYRRRKHRSLIWTLIAYCLFGLLPATSAFYVDTLSFASLMHATTLVFASLTLASLAGTMLFVREEAEILLHRPVQPAHLLRAKSFVMVAFALLLAGALNLAGLVTGLWSQGATAWFVPAHALATLLLMLFASSLIVLVYNACLRWFGRDRLDNLLATVQTLLAVIMVAGGQLMPRLFGMDALRSLDMSHGWALVLPPVWFGALDALLCGAEPAARVWLPATMAVGATVLCAWLAFVRLGAAYGIGLMVLNESAGPARGESRRRLLSGLLRLPPLRWWLRDPIERQAFLLTSAYMVRDRETKLKLYPGVAPMVILPIFMALGTGTARGAAPSSDSGGIAMAFCAMVPIQALLLLHRSEHWRAAAVFRAAPLVHWTPLFHGARKAVLCWLCLPVLTLIASVIALARGSWLPVVLALPMLVVLMVCSLIPGVIGPWLPLSQPNQDQRDTSIGCLVYGVVTLAAAAVGGLATWAQHLGWLWPFLGLTMAAGLGLQALLARRMRARRWRPANEYAGSPRLRGGLRS